jgi:hypothetical protein
LGFTTTLWRRFQQEQQDQAKQLQFFSSEMQFGRKHDAESKCRFKLYRVNAKSRVKNYLLLPEFTNGKLLHHYYYRMYTKVVGMPAHSAISAHLVLEHMVFGCRFSIRKCQQSVRFFGLNQTIYRSRENSLKTAVLMLLIAYSSLHSINLGYMLT